MPDKQRGDVEFAFLNGYFVSHSHFSNIQLYQIFEREVSVGKCLPPLIRSDGHVLVFVMTGCGTVSFGDYSLDVNPDTVVLAPAFHDIKIAPGENSKSLRYICLNVEIRRSDINDEHDRLYDHYLFDEEPLIVHNARYVRQCLSLFIAELCATKSSPWLVMGYLDQLMIQIRRAQNHTAEDDEPLNTMSSTAVGHTVYAIICYIDEHLFTMNSLMDMARDLGYSYNYLSHVFRKKTGQTIQTYVSQKKIERSMDLLENEHYSITEIASMLNYDCIQSFSKAFKKVMHMSPTEFRAKRGISE